MITEIQEQTVTPLASTEGVPQQSGGGVPGQYDRLIEGSRLIHSWLCVQYPRGARGYRPPYIGIPACSDRLTGGPLLLCCQILISQMILISRDFSSGN